MAWRALVLLLAFPRTAIARVELADSPQAARDARTLEARLERVEAELAEKREALGLKSLNLDPFSTRPAETAGGARGIGGEYSRSVLPLAQEAAAIADRLSIYRETGRLPRAARRLDPRVFDLEPAPYRGLALPPLGLAELRRQLAPFHAVLFPRPEALAAAPEVPRPPRAAARPEAGFMRDRGAGRPARDPVPELIAQLSSPRAVERALAADELGKRGEDAAPAVLALRRAAVGDEDGRVRASAVLALGGAGQLPPEALADLRRALLDPDAEVRFSARAALRRLGAP